MVFAARQAEISACGVHAELEMPLRRFWRRNGSSDGGVVGISARIYQAPCRKRREQIEAMAWYGRCGVAARITWRRESRFENSAVAQ